MFLITICSIWALILAHVFFRTHSFFGMGAKVRSAVGIGLFILGFGYIPVTVLIRLDATVGLMSVPAIVTASFIGLVSILWTLLVLIESFVLLFRLAAHRRLRDASPRLRRTIGAVWWIASAVLACLGVQSALTTPSITRLQLSVPGMEPGRLVVISDTHLGAISSIDQWMRTLEAARAEDPCALIFAGDLIDDWTDRAERQVAMIREFFPEKPVYAVMGNHEQYTSLNYFEALCERFRFRLLRQESEIVVPRLSIAGIDYCIGEEAAGAVEKAVAGVDGALLFIAHRPEAALYLRERPGTLVLAGHTHGGQIPPTVFLTALGNNGFCAGTYRAGRAHLHVSRGAGVWGPPMRLLAPPDIVVIELRDGQEFDVVSPPS